MEKKHTSASSFFFSFLGLLGALAFFSTLVFSFLKGARSLESKLGLLGRSSFLDASESAAYMSSQYVGKTGARLRDTNRLRLLGDRSLGSGRLCCGSSFSGRSGGLLGFVFLFRRLLEWR